MNDRLALRVLGEVMHWDDETARKEFRYLAWMARAKYDAYQDYVAGGRFLEHLVRWLQQFKQEDREAAWRLVRYRLIFISVGEMQRLVELFYPQVIEPLLVKEVSLRLKIPTWRVWTDPAASEQVRRLRRCCLFMGLSDGARLDRFRRANESRISNEQVVLQTQLDSEKWGDLANELRKDLGDSGARFLMVFLIDDFIGSGTSLLGKRNDDWKGKLPRFARVVADQKNLPLDDEWRLCVHHYLANAEVLERINENWNKWRPSLEMSCFPSQVHLTDGLRLPPEISFREKRPEDAAIWALTENYYDDAVETRSILVGGEHAKRGFAHCALPLVLEHNTPNNSIALLWAETRGENGHEMRPLFRRRQRHG